MPSRDMAVQTAVEPENDSDDLYARLGVGRDATLFEIRRAFRTLSKKLHPDRNKDPDATAQFQRVREAYETLSDELKRRDYDEAGVTVSNLKHLQNEAEALIAECFKSLLNRTDLDPERTDYLKQIRRELHNSITSQKREMDSLKGEKKRIQKAKRFKSRKGFKNLFNILLEDRLKTLDQSYQEMYKQRMRLELALDILEDYDIEMPEEGDFETVLSSAEFRWR